ncbi:MAG: MacB family efflux pump subunit [Alphaproteobacteria bacterium]|nr:MacB family efflux pump subunit [Alphaproteobacteria bacterium]
MSTAIPLPLAAVAAPAAAPASPPVIRVRGLARSFHRGETETLALRGVDLDIVHGEFVAIVGPSGCGKTTLMNLLGLLDRPTGGSYRLEGEEVADLDDDARAGLRRDRFGFIFQQYNLLSTATALENVEIPAVYAGRPRDEREERAADLLETLGLGERLDHRPAQLSGGQQQRVSIARALMNGAEVILADEPTGALDSASGRDVMALLRRLHAEGHTIILITHDQNVAQQADRIVEMQDGLIVRDSGRRSVHRVAPQPPPRRTGVVAPAIGELLRTAARSLRVNLMRTVLTLLGVVIGVASVVAMLAIGNGAKQVILDQINDMGPDLLVIRPGARNVRTVAGVSTLVDSDRQAIERLPGVRGAFSEYSFNATVRYGGYDVTTTIDATLPSFPVVRNWTMARGVFFSQADMDGFAAVAVLGQTVVNNLYPPGADPLGTFVMINNVPFQVIGVLSPKGANPWGWDLDDGIFVPLTTGRLRLHGQNYVRVITAQVADLSQMDAVQQAITQLLTARHGVVDFQIRNTAAIFAAASASQDTLTLLLGAIAMISLLVGGIGVMNIMLVSVTERTREIGIRMATGARPRDIMLQFNAEALAVCAVGGVLGVALGIGATLLMGAAGRPVMITLGPIVLAFGCAFVTGLVFGHLPARKAAGLDPVVALASD